MVFFNYSTMQMAAKVVYYGPGLCGKTTNLHYIYTHTANDSRGEMVSLETETDRTLFFDLLPIDVGSIAGFNTRIQLYTVPGQVFYNTTRKLVLKGVDGVVFVADSQRAMLQANTESFRNLEENLAEMGLKVDGLPMVLQFNKRDLPDICTVEEMNQVLNRGNWPWFEASALAGEGVFETLKGISKVTLMSLKKRLARPETSRPPARPTPAAAGAAPTTGAPAGAERTATGTAPGAAAPKPPPAGGVPRPGAAPPARPPGSPPPAAGQPGARPAGAPAPTPPAAPRPPAAPPAPAAASARGAADSALSPTPPPGKGIRSVDVLSELEKLRRQALEPSPTVSAAARNGRAELSRSLELSLPRADFARARRVLVTLQVADEDNRIVETVRDLQVDIKEAAQLEKLLLRLNIALTAGE